MDKLQLTYLAEMVQNIKDTEIYEINSRFYEYGFDMHMNKLYMSITEAAIATRQRIDREDFKERN